MSGTKQSRRQKLSPP